MDGEDAVLVEQRLRQRDIVFVRVRPRSRNDVIAPYSAGSSGVRIWTCGRSLHLAHPAIAQRPQPRRAPRAADRRLERQRGRDGQLRGIIGRAGMDAREDVGALGLFRRIGIDRADPVAADVDRADAERRADPFVQVDADEIGLEVGQAEVELADAVRGIDQHVDPALRAPSSRFRRRAGPGRCGG